MTKILFVCTGNTCRSPMAEAVFNDMAKKKGLCAEASSAGLYAEANAETSQGAVLALSEMGIEHKSFSRPLSAELEAAADVIYGITSRHAETVKMAYPQFAFKVKTFPFEIPDPFGGGAEVYRGCLASIVKGVDIITEELRKSEKRF